MFVCVCGSDRGPSRCTLGETREPERTASCTTRAVAKSKAKDAKDAKDAGSMVVGRVLGGG